MSQGAGKSSPYLTDVLLGLVPPRWGLEATCLCPPSSQCWRGLFHYSAYSFAHSCLWICQQYLCLCSPLHRARCGEDSTGRLSLWSPFSLTKDAVLLPATPLFVGFLLEHESHYSFPVSFQFLIPFEDWSYLKENIWERSGQFGHCPVPKSSRWRGEMKSWEGEPNPRQSRVSVSLKMLLPSVFGVDFLKVHGVPLGWGWFCTSGRDDYHVVVFIWRGCAAVFRQHYAPNWEFKFQLVDWGWKAELWDRNGQAQNAEAPNLLQYVCLIQSGLLRLFCRVE